MSSISTRLRYAGLAGHRFESWPMDPVRLVMLAALPVAVLVGSPQRVALSALIASAYVLAAIVTVRATRLAVAAVVGYASVAGAWTVVTWLRSRYLLHLQPDQIAYGTAKTEYFVLIVLPMAAAVALMVDRARAIWPTALSQVAIGSAVAVVTVVTLGNHFLGADRYSWQGDLIALGTVVVVQPWPIKRFAAAPLLGLLGVVGVMFASSRQAVVALIAALLLSAAYWAAARLKNKAAVGIRYVVTPVVLVVVLIGFLALTYAHIHLPFGSTPAGSCYCVTDRFVSLEAGAGDRDTMLKQGFQLFLQQPMLGAGPGSFAGRVGDSLHPGQFYQYPHNVPLEIASETGIIGLLLLLVPLVAGWGILLWRGIKAGSAPVATVLALLVVFLVVANLSGDIPSERGLWIFGLVAFRLGVDRLRRPTVAPETAVEASA